MPSGDILLRRLSSSEVQNEVLGKKDLSATEALKQSYCHSNFSLLVGKLTNTA